MASSNKAWEGNLRGANTKSKKDKQNISVYVRCRPFSEEEKKNGVAKVVSCNQTDVEVCNKGYLRLSSELAYPSLGIIPDRPCCSRPQFPRESAIEPGLIFKITNLNFQQLKERATGSSGQHLTKKFNFDRVFSPAADQIEVYQEVVAPVVKEALLGKSTGFIVSL